MKTGEHDALAGQTKPSVSMGGEKSTECSAQESPATELVCLLLDVAHVAQQRRKNLVDTMPKRHVSRFLYVLL